MILVTAIQCRCSGWEQVRRDGRGHPGGAIRTSRHTVVFRCDACRDAVGPLGRWLGLIKSRLKT
jgi:hypothetical protein